MTRLLPLITLLFSLVSCGPKIRVSGPPIPLRDPLTTTTAPTTPSASDKRIETSAATGIVASQEGPTPTAGANTGDSAVNAAVGRINELLDAHFDFNAYQLRPDAVEAVMQAASILKTHMAADTSIRLVIEGHCDERGSAEFNLALGERRAESVRDLLAQLGIGPNRMATISFGETRPACGDAVEACWQRNRRAHIRHER